MVSALGFQADGSFAVQLSDGSVICVPERDLVGLSSVCRWADLFGREPKEHDNPYFQERVYGDAALDAHVRETTGDDE